MQPSRPTTTSSGPDGHQQQQLQNGQRRQVEPRRGGDEIESIRDGDQRTKEKDLKEDNSREGQRQPVHLREERPASVDELASGGAEVDLRSSAGHGQSAFPNKAQRRLQQPPDDQQPAKPLDQRGHLIQSTDIDESTPVLPLLSRSAGRESSSADVALVTAIGGFKAEAGAPCQHVQPSPEDLQGAPGQALTVPQAYSGEIHHRHRHHQEQHHKPKQVHLPVDEMAQQRQSEQQETRSSPFDLFTNFGALRGPFPNQPAMVTPSASARMTSSRTRGSMAPAFSTGHLYAAAPASGGAVASRSTTMNIEAGLVCRNDQRSQHRQQLQQQALPSRVGAASLIPRRTAAPFGHASLPGGGQQLVNSGMPSDVLPHTMQAGELNDRQAAFTSMATAQAAAAASPAVVATTGLLGLAAAGNPAALSLPPGTVSATLALDSALTRTGTEAEPPNVQGVGHGWSFAPVPPSTLAAQPTDHLALTLPPSLPSPGTLDVPSADPLPNAADPVTPQPEASPAAPSASSGSAAVAAAEAGLLSEIQAAGGMDQIWGIVLLNRHLEEALKKALEEKKVSEEERERLKRRVERLERDVRERSTWVQPQLQRFENQVVVLTGRVLQLQERNKRLVQQKEEADKVVEEMRMQLEGLKLAQLQEQLGAGDTLLQTLAATATRPMQARNTASGHTRLGNEEIDPEKMEEDGLKHSEMEVQNTLVREQAAPDGAAAAAATAAVAADAAATATSTTSAAVLIKGFAGKQTSLQSGKEVLQPGESARQILGGGGGEGGGRGGEGGGPPGVSLGRNTMPALAPKAASTGAEGNTETAPGPPITGVGRASGEGVVRPVSCHGSLEDQLQGASGHDEGNEGGEGALSTAAAGLKETIDSVLAKVRVLVQLLKRETESDQVSGAYLDEQSGSQKEEPREVLQPRRQKQGGGEGGRSLFLAPDPGAWQKQVENRAVLAAADSVLGDLLMASSMVERLSSRIGAATGTGGSLQPLPHVLLGSRKRVRDQDDQKVN